MKTPELLAPGGSFQSAYQAFQAGADGVYLGITEFSARKAAVNFSFEQLRRITGLARDRGKRIYVTVNTVIRDSELGRLGESLFRLESLRVDGVIVQDLGVLSLLGRHFPSIPVHASTQMAVHSSLGIEEVKSLGVRRVILSRELPLSRIRALKAAHSDMELEVFIHGALCYSFSGLCFASRFLTGRSGNRGECAQICRSLFRTIGAEDRGSGRGGGSRVARDSDGGVNRVAGAAAAPGSPSGGPHERSCADLSESGLPSEGHFFSCRDLRLGRDILELADAGVDAFKIEGRMKSPEYVFHTVRMYRRILDEGKSLPEEELEDLMRRSALSFSRRTTRGFLHSPSGEDFIDAEFPGHRGVLLGTVQTIRGRDASVTLLGDLSIRDGIGYYPDEPVQVQARRAPKKGRAAERGPFIFSLSRIRKGGEDVKFARRGETVRIELEPSPAGALPAAGQDIWQFSSRFLDLPQPKEGSFPPARIPVELSIRLSRGASGFALTIEAVCEPLAKRSAAFGREVAVERASSEKPFAGVLSRFFSESGESLFTAGGIAFVNESGLPDNGIFIPPSALKKVKNELYADLDSRFEEAAKEHGRLVSGAGEGAPAASSAPRSMGRPRPDPAKLSARQSLTWKSCAPVPFVCLGPDGEIPDISEAPVVDGITFVPLPPVIMNEGALLEALERTLDANPGTTFAIGLSNVSHLSFARRLASRNNSWFFIDFPLYSANRHAARFFSESVERLLFQYSWIEGSAEDHDALAAAAGVPLVSVDPGFIPPLFYGLGCIAKHVMNDGACLEGCPKSFRAELRQGKNRFRLVVRDCVSYLFAGGG